MEEILKYCIKVNGIRAYYPLYEKTTDIIESSSDMSMKFGWNNGRVSFVTEDGSYYVTPFCFDVAEALKKLGYESVGLYVPFSNGDIPEDKELAEKWEDLCQEARKKFLERQELEKQERYKKIAEEKRISPLSEEVYELSLEIPQDGLETTWLGKNDKTNPVQEWKILECMGTYCQNNGRVVFVDEKGKTYVTPFCFEVRQMLSEAGYKEGSIFVPLSNGEQIVDSKKSARWDIMCEEAYKKNVEREEKRKQERYKKIAEEKGLRELPSEVYEMSLEIPQSGLETTWFGQKNTISPVFDWELQRCMGIYCQNNGRVVFVDEKGKTYVTPFCFEIRQMLSEAGYKEGSLFVPLSNGEQIVDRLKYLKWEILCDKSNQKHEEESNNSFKI